jgi:DNA polymerase III gamma/tau subunit
VNVAKKEGFSLEKGAAELIALLGDGSFRDTLSTLQKIVSFSKDSKISIAEVERVTGAPKIESVNNFIAALASKDVEKGLKILEKIDSPQLFSTLVLERVRYVLLMKVMKDFKPDLSDEDVDFLKKIENINSQTLVAVIDAVILTKQINDNSALELLLFKISN